MSEVIQLPISCSSRFRGEWYCIVYRKMVGDRITYTTCVSDKDNYELEEQKLNGLRGKLRGEVLAVIPRVGQPFINSLRNYLVAWSQKDKTADDLDLEEVLEMNKPSLSERIVKGHYSTILGINYEDYFCD